MFVEQEWILKRAALTPHHIALINLTSKEQWTYQQLSEEIGKWSQFFEQRDYKREVESLFLREIISNCLLFYLPVGYVGSFMYL